MVHFKAINGLRFIAFLPIFFLHACGGELLYTLTLAALDMFFLLSGFLTGYGRIQDFSPSEQAKATKQGIWHYNVQYMLQKLRVFYPWHIVCFLWCLLIIFLSPATAGFVPHTLTEWIWKTPLHLLLLQSWSCEPNIKFCFNGVTWFLSSLMFCYALSPLLLALLARVYRKWGKCSLYIVGGIALLLKATPYIFEADLSISDDFTSLYDKDIHSWPPLRLLDFCLGMCAGIILRMTSAPKICRNNIIQYISVFLLLFSAYYIPGPITLLLSTIWLYTLVAATSAVSKLLSFGMFTFLGKLVMPTFLTHNLVMKSLRGLGFSTTSITHALATFVVCFVISWLLIQLRQWRNSSLKK